MEPGAPWQNWIPQVGLKFRRAPSLEVFDFQSVCQNAWVGGFYRRNGRSLPGKHLEVMNTSAQAKLQPSTSAMTGIVERNIQALLQRRELDEQRLGWQERLADTITRFSGSMKFVYLHLLIY